MEQENVYIHTGRDYRTCTLFDKYTKIWNTGTFCLHRLVVKDKTFWGNILTERPVYSPGSLTGLDFTTHVEMLADQFKRWQQKNISNLIRTLHFKTCRNILIPCRRAAGSWWRWRRSPPSPWPWRRGGCSSLKPPYTADDPPKTSDLEHPEKPTSVIWSKLVLFYIRIFKMCWLTHNVAQLHQTSVHGLLQKH